MTRDNQPRWIADLETLVMYERQADGSYKPAYKMAQFPLRTT